MPGLVKMVNGNCVGETKPEDHDWDCPECSEKKRPMRRIVVIVIIIIILVYIYNVCMNSLQIWVSGWVAVQMQMVHPQYITS